MGTLPGRHHGGGAAGQGERGPAERVQTRRAIVRNPLELRRAFEAWAPHLDGQPCLVTIGPQRPRRSLAQNSLLHALLAQLASHLGYTPDELKDVVKELYGRKRMVEIGGRRVMVPVSTAHYTKAELSDMIVLVEKLAAEYGCPLEEHPEC